MTALDRAIQAVGELAKMEEENPGTLSASVAEQLELTGRKVDELISALGKVKRSLSQKKVSLIGV